MAAPVKFVWAGWLLVVLVDGGSDFPGAIPREAAQPSEGTQPRTPRQSLTPAFSQESSNEPYSFQSFVMGADALAELDLPADEAEPQHDRNGRQFAFNNLDFEGFDFPPTPSVRPQHRATTGTPAFHNFPSAQFGSSPPQFQSPGRRRTFSRARQPLPTRMQSLPTAAPSFPSPPAPRAFGRGRGIRPPPNADPRVRGRGRRPEVNPPSVSFSTTSSASAVSTTPNFLNFPSSFAASAPREEVARTVQSSPRGRARVLTRPAARTLQQQITSPPRLDFPTFTRFTNRPEPKAREKAVTTENPVIMRCLEETEKHAAQIAELENRTALHIEYAQEKQIEIELLESSLDAANNKSKLDGMMMDELRGTILNLTNINKAKEADIESLAHDITKLEVTFENEIQMKHDKIVNLTSTVENLETAIKVMKATVTEKRNEQMEINSKLEESRSKVYKLKTEKRELLQIIQQLAEIGNPALNFNTFLNADQDFSLNPFEPENNKKTNEKLEIDMEDYYDYGTEEGSGQPDEGSEKVPVHMFMPLRSLRSLSVYKA